MNYLGHLYLTRKFQEFTYGNFIGDFIKGKKVFDLPTNDRIGVELHRKIDSYTDQHLITKKTKRIFSSQFGHYSGILVDMYFDHILAKKWSIYHSSDLVNFAENQYHVLDERVNDMPEMCSYMYSYFKKDNWLTRYIYLDGTVQSLSGMTKRFGFKSDLSLSKELFVENELEIEANFDDFIVSISQYIEREIAFYKQ